jgi:MYXO-CTERM domain-containing protein
MATLLATEVKNEDWAETRPSTVDGAHSGRVGWLWTLIGLALLGAFLAFMVDDYPLRALIAAN